MKDKRGDDGRGNSRCYEQQKQLFFCFSSSLIFFSAKESNLENMANKAWKADKDGWKADQDKDKKITYLIKHTHISVFLTFQEAVKLTKQGLITKETVS